MVPQTVKQKPPMLDGAGQIVSVKLTTWNNYMNSVLDLYNLSWSLFPYDLNCAK